MDALFVSTCMGRPGALMAAPYMRAGVHMVFDNHILLQASWKCAWWYCRSSRDRATYPRVNRSLVACVIEKLPLILIRVTAGYT